MFMFCSIDSGCAQSCQALEFPSQDQNLIGPVPKSYRGEPQTIWTVRTDDKERAVPAPTAEFLRRQADNCIRVARQCFDLTASERLRIMAAELRAKADEIEDKEDRQIPPQTMQRNGSSNGESDHG